MYERARNEDAPIMIKLAIAEIGQTAIDNEYDIILKQEPLTRDLQIRGMKLVKPLTDDSLTCIYISNKYCVLKLEQYCNKYCTCVQIIADGLEIILVTAYFKFNEAILIGCQT